MTEKSFEQRLAECERVLRKLEGTSANKSEYGCSEKCGS
jgi:hypothetical protein